MHSLQSALSLSVTPQKNCVVIPGPSLSSAIPRAEPEEQKARYQATKLHFAVFTASRRLGTPLPGEAAKLCPHCAVRAAQQWRRPQQSQTKRRSPRGGRELCRKCTALLGKQQECGTKVTAAAQGRQMKAGSILHYVV